jgi:hypothetical protein
MAEFWEGLGTLDPLPAAPQAAATDAPHAPLANDAPDWVQGLGKLDPLPQIPGGPGAMGPEGKEVPPEQSADPQFHPNGPTTDANGRPVSPVGQFASDYASSLGGEASTVGRNLAGGVMSLGGNTAQMGLRVGSMLTQPVVAPLSEPFNVQDATEMATLQKSVDQAKQAAAGGDPTAFAWLAANEPRLNALKQQFAPPAPTIMQQTGQAMDSVRSDLHDAMTKWAAENTAADKADGYPALGQAISMISEFAPRRLADLLEMTTAPRIAAMTVVTMSMVRRLNRLFIQGAKMHAASAPTKIQSGNRNAFLCCVTVHSKLPPAFVFMGRQLSFLGCGRPNPRLIRSR